MPAWYLRDNSTAGVVGNGTVGWSAVTPWSAGASIAVGALRRQLAAPAVGSERVFLCVAVTTGLTGGTEPAWALGRGAKTTDAGVTWEECTGRAAVNGDRANTPAINASTGMRSTALALGFFCKDSSGTNLFIVTTAGTTAASAPTLNTAALGNTTADGTVVWTYVGTSFGQWAAPHARVSVAAGASWPAAGDDIYAASDHNEVWAGTFNFGFQGTPAAPCNLWCIPAAGDLTAGPQSLASDPYSQVPACAQLATTGSFNLAFASGNINVYGWVFSCGTGAAASTLTFNQKGRMERCSLRLPATLGGTMTLVTGDSVDCSVALGNTSSQVRPTPGARSRWVGGTAPAVLIYSGAVAPLALVGGGSNGEIILDGLDLSNLGAGTTLLQGSTFAMRQVMQNCKINPAATMSSVPTDHAQTAEFVNCQASGGAVSYLQARHRYSGLMLTSAAVYRTGGATLPETGVGISWQIATTANAKWLIPFEAPAMAIWNGTVGAPVKVTIYGNGPAVPNNDEIWCEVEYLGDAATSLASVAHNTKTSYLAAAAPQLSDASAWTGGNTAFRLEVTVTPQRAGYLYVRVKAARPGTTYYIDRKPVLS